MIKIIITELDKYEIAVKKFRRSCMSSGLYSKVRSRFFHLKPAAKRRKKKLSSHSYIVLRKKREAIKYKR